MNEIKFCEDGQTSLHPLAFGSGSEVQKKTLYSLNGGLKEQIQDAVQK